MPEPVRLVVYSDYLCPWCYVATKRLDRLREEFGESLELRWQSFLLRPDPGSIRDLDKFKAYTRSWLRPAAEPEAPAFRVWDSDAGPPSHSVPPHVVAKAAAAIGPDAFERIHERLLTAYFGENQDITDESTLRGLWKETGLPDAEFERSADPALPERILAEHREAIESGVTGVPAVRLESADTPIVGALPLETYRRWIRKVLEGGAL